MTTIDFIHRMHKIIPDMLPLEPVQRISRLKSNARFVFANPYPEKMLPLKANICNKRRLAYLE